MTHQLYTPPGLYRHRPTIIHALQYTPATWPSLRVWLDGELGRAHYDHTDGHLVIYSPEGDRDCPHGYWIAKEPGDFGGMYCIRPALFPALYEDAGAQAYLPRHAAGGAA